MDCQQFIHHYSDYLDGCLDDRRLARRIDSHLTRCVRCRHRLATLERGVSALRSDDVAPSPRFKARLNRRLRSEISIGDPMVPTSAGLAAALLLATGVGLFLYEGVGTPPAEEPVAARTAPNAFADTLPPPANEVDVTLPAFTHSTLQFHSSQVPLGTQVVFAR